MEEETFNERLAIHCVRSLFNYQDCKLQNASKRHAYVTCIIVYSKHMKTLLVAFYVKG